MPRNSIVHSVRDWVVFHPALFSGLVIYAYYVLSSVNFLIAHFKAGHGRSLGLWDYISQFDALPFMWLLAYTFVQLLVFRERVHEKEKQAINQQRKMDIQATQFRTLQEVAVTLMDKINNPAAVIVMYVRRLAKKIRRSSELYPDLEAIQKAAFRISKTLQEMSSMEEYKFLEESYRRIIELTKIKK